MSVLRSEQDRMEAFHACRGGGGRVQLWPGVLGGGGVLGGVGGGGGDEHGVGGG